MKNLLGGNVRAMVTGGAPISADVLNFLKISFCCPITEVYGMTESGGASVMVKIGDP
jgi:long-chain acyl-CoA synthetase